MKKKALILILPFLLSLNVFIAYAQHGGGSFAPINPNPTGISPLTWLIFLFILLALVIFFGWLFRKDKKKF